MRATFPALERVVQGKPGRTFKGSLGSVLVKCTVPVYPVIVLLAASLAATVTANAVPAVAVAGAVTSKWSSGR